MSNTKKMTTFATSKNRKINKQEEKQLNIIYITMHKRGNFAQNK